LVFSYLPRSAELLGKQICILLLFFQKIIENRKGEKTDEKEKTNEREREWQRDAISQSIWCQSQFFAGLRESHH
jgi:hypothetical protein